jgi:hypothetical protein
MHFGQDGICAAQYRASRREARHLRPVGDLKALKIKLVWSGRFPCAPSRAHGMDSDFATHKYFNKKIKFL